MIVLPSGETISDNEKEYEGIPPLREDEDDESSEEVSIDQPIGLGLVRRKALNTQRIDEDVQRENIFYTRCLVNGKVCSLIVDDGSCTNIISALMVKKLQLPTHNHPWPYKLQ